MEEEVAQYEARRRDREQGNVHNIKCENPILKASFKICEYVMLLKNPTEKFIVWSYFLCLL